MEGWTMKKIARHIAALLFILYVLPQGAMAVQLLVPGGQVVGLELGDGSITVAAFDDALGSAARDAGLQVGDRILQVDGNPVSQPEDIRLALERSEGSVELRIQRLGKEKTLHLNPQITGDGPRLGVYLKRGVTGIGTVTFYDPATGRFGALGHGVNDSSGNLLHLTDGSAYRAAVSSVKKGKSGAPGQLHGSVLGELPVGTLDINSAQGVFGTAETGFSGEAIPVAAFEQIRTGEAEIYSTVSGDGLQEYSVEILKIYPEDRADGRNLLLRVTDPDLLETTGGIVQGMSGSPIIQDGKLVGAVTHVLVNQPDTGYGIFIENMLDAAS